MILGRTISRQHEDARIPHAGSHPVGIFSVLSTSLVVQIFVAHIFMPSPTREKCVNSSVSTATRPNAVALRAEYLLHRVVAAYALISDLLPKICFVDLHKT